MHLLRQGRLGTSNILKDATEKLVLTRVMSFYDNSSNVFKLWDAVYLILTNTMAEEHRNQ